MAALQHQQHDLDGEYEHSEYERRLAEATVAAAQQEVQHHDMYASWAQAAAARAATAAAQRQQQPAPQSEWATILAGQEEERRLREAQARARAEVEEQVRLSYGSHGSHTGGGGGYTPLMAGQFDDDGAESDAGEEIDEDEQEDEDEPRFQILEERRHGQDEVVGCGGGLNDNTVTVSRGKPEAMAMARARAAAEAVAASIPSSNPSASDIRLTVPVASHDKRVVGTVNAPVQTTGTATDHFDDDGDDDDEEDNSGSNDDDEEQNDDDIQDKTAVELFEKPFQALPQPVKAATVPTRKLPHYDPDRKSGRASQTKSMDESSDDDSKYYSSDSDNEESLTASVSPSCPTGQANKAKPPPVTSTKLSTATPPKKTKKTVASAEKGEGVTPSSTIKQKKKKKKTMSHQKDEDNKQDENSTSATTKTTTPTPKKKKKKVSSTSTTPSSKKSPSSTSKSTKGKTPVTTASSKKSKTSTTSTTSTKKKGGGSGKSGSGGQPVPSIDDPVPDITDVEYENVEQLMVQFCRVPLLAEFSRPVSLLHPELMPIYSTVIKHPIDLGRVCRAIRRRQYKNTRAIRLDMWRIFANCVKFHTDSSAKDTAVPSFISIALHLREYFNALWQEYMLPSDTPASPSGKHSSGKGAFGSFMRVAYDKRDQARKKRLSSTSTTILSVKCIEKTAAAIQQFLDLGGRVDHLDADPIITEDDDEDEGDMDAAVDNLTALKSRLLAIAASNQEYTMDELERNLKNCYSGELFEYRPSMRKKITQRLNRLLGKIVVPIYEANCRGVNQSSVWGCMAAAIWARESSKKPYWPALVLGILAPDDQKEDWHVALTQRNEARLPEKLRAELQVGKRKAELALHRQSTGGAEQMSYFLVEFMGTHEFIWVKEADIIENFHPDDDPNQSIAAGNVTKKKKHSRGHGHSPASAKIFEQAIEEGRWALEEFEMQLNDTCGDLDMSEDEDDDEEELNYSYAILCQSDDEADEMATDSDERERRRSTSEDEERNELLATEGLLDFSVAGRKNAKKRAAALKKQKAEERKAALKKEKEDQAKKAKELAKQAKVQQKKKKKSGIHALTKAKAKEKAKTKEQKKFERDREKEEKREQRELEKRRKKREKERERVIKEQSRKGKRKRTLSPDSAKGQVRKRRRRSGIPDKRGRSTAIVRGYLTRIAKEEDMKGLGFGGVMTLPASGVESSGLLGMAIAFRAAAGEINTPDGNDTRLKPWEQIDVDGPLTTEERCQNLEKQIELIERELNKLASAKKRRMVLIDEALARKKANEEEILHQEKEARKSIIPEKKKYNKRVIVAKQGKSKTKNDEDDKEGEDTSEVKRSRAGVSDESPQQEDRDVEYDQGSEVMEEEHEEKVVGDPKSAKTQRRENEMEEADPESDEEEEEETASNVDDMDDDVHDIQNEANVEISTDQFEDADEY